MDDKASFDLVRASVNVVLVRIADRVGNLLETAFINDVRGFHGRNGYFVGRPCLGAGERRIPHHRRAVRDRRMVHYGRELLLRSASWLLSLIHFGGIAAMVSDGRPGSLYR